MADANSTPSKDSDFDVPPAKRTKMEQSTSNQPGASTSGTASTPANSDRKGVAAIKQEFLVSVDSQPRGHSSAPDDDAAEASKHTNTMSDAISFTRDPRDVRDSRDSRDSRDWRGNRNSRGRGRGRGNRAGNDGGDQKRDRGQNKARKFGHWGDAIQLCNTRILKPEFSPNECTFGDKCRKEHDLRKYMSEGRHPDLTTLDGKCPVFEAHGFCTNGWKCRFVGSHSKEIEHEDGRKELVLLGEEPQEGHRDTSVFNIVDKQHKIDLERRKVTMERSEKYLEWLNETWNVEVTKRNNRAVSYGDYETSTNDGNEPGNQAANDAVKTPNGSELKVEHESEANNNMEGRSHADAELAKGDKEDINEEVEEHRATYTEPPFRPSEKRRIYYGAETPILAPLTTQGNLPFRRLCVDLGAQVTWSEMAVSMPLLQGGGSEWALMKAHESEISPPKVNNPETVAGYDHAKDLKFGVQIAANKPWVAFKTTEALSRFCPQLRAIDLNCGCPIDLIYKTGAGSALLDAPAKLEKILRGMNALSGEVPITCKIRMGTRDSRPNADSVVNRLLLGGHDTQQLGLGPSGVAAITLHGRSRQQRYSRLADWGYISDIAALINRINIHTAAQTDTAAEVDERDKPNGGRVYFVGNGDCFSHVDYFNHISSDRVDSVMIARGALIKPWIFEEIESGQYLDKTATERLAYIEKFVKYGLDTWGSDEMGIGTTRRFLLEWLSFSYRYIPIGILEHLPPRMNERPPAFRGRDDMESLLASDNYRDWIKISEMFLGPAHENFKFQPKHKSNSYEMEAEG